MTRKVKNRKKIPRVIKQCGFIKLLCRLNEKSRKLLLQQCKSCEINALCEIVLNFLNKNVTQNKKIVAKLKKYKNMMREIAYKSTPIARKRSLFKSKRGGTILSLLLPIVSTLTSLLIK